MLKIFEKMRNGQDAVIDPAKMFQHDFKIDAVKPGPPPGLRKFECRRFIGITPGASSSHAAATQVRTQEDDQEHSEDENYYST